ncbi:hypothetical protein [Streptomyces sp. NPDC055287]
MASRIEGLCETDFDTAVRTMKCQAFVEASEKACQGSSATGTLSLEVNGALRREFRMGQLAYYVQDPS